MKRLVRLGALLVLGGASVSAQEITLEEVRVEAPSVSLFDLPVTDALQKFIEGLRLNDETTRALELRKANQSSLTHLLELTRYVPIPLGGSDPHQDSFPASSYLRADLAAPKASPLFPPD